jgi:hypothetical protein
MLDGIFATLVGDPVAGRMVSDRAFAQARARLQMPALQWLNDQLIDAAPTPRSCRSGAGAAWWPPMPRCSCRPSAPVTALSMSPVPSSVCSRCTCPALS